MIVAYAMGGGLGHVRRARAALAVLAPQAPHAILTASRLASGDDLIRVPRQLARAPAAFAGWLRAELRALAPAAIVVDAFPLGVVGELAQRRVLPDVPLYHLARLLRWDAYAGAFPGTPPRYTAINFGGQSLASARNHQWRDRPGNSPFRLPGRRAAFDLRAGYHQPASYLRHGALAHSSHLEW